MRRAILGLGFLAIVGLTACGQQGLRSVSQPSEGPDEFMVVPSNPLSPPKSYTQLPTPTPGGTNLADRDSQAEMIVALGGRVPTSDAIPASDAALIAAASRNGSGGNTRAQLQQEFDERLGRAQRWQSLRLVDRYDDLFRDEWLDQRAEAERFRRSGVPVSNAPPN